MLTEGAPIGCINWYQLGARTSNYLVKELKNYGRVGANDLNENEWEWREWEKKDFCLAN